MAAWIPTVEAELIAKLHTYPNLLLWIAGHRHLNTVTAFKSPDANRPELGFWQVETSSLREFPQQFRTFQIVRNSDQTISILTTNVDPAVKDGSFAALSRSYAIAAQQIFNSKIPLLPTGSYNAELVKPLSPEMQVKMENYGTPISKRSESGNGTDSRFGFTYPDLANYSALTWTDAFKVAHDKFSHEYAFGDWKGVDWPDLYSRFLPRIVQAQAAGDEKAYYLALHEYVCSIPDGHLSLSAENTAVPTALAKELVGGGFGMAVAELDDGRVMVAAVIPDSPATQAGITVSAEIITWGGVPAEVAIGQINVGAIPFKILTGAFGNENPKATVILNRLEQVRLLTRGPVGSSVQIAFKNPGQVSSQTATLTAVDDAGQTFSLLNFASRPDFSDQVDYRILPEGYGYVLVRMEYDMSNPGGYPTRIYQQFQEAITSFVAASMPGVIVDLRGNYGGSDQLAADLCGFFYSSTAFYEEQEYFDKRDGQFLRITVSERGPDPIVDKISIEPQTPYFGGPVVVLVNLNTTSSGEGIPMGISRLPKGKVIGFHGTNGSFGMVGGEIALPGGYAIGYPFGRSVDQNGVVQLDSRNGIGGVTPNPRVPKTLENVLAFAAGIDVELQYAIDVLQGQ
jgi:carboxyl-terminal processing protease